MEIFSFGEDALTLWALKHRLPYILGRLGDESFPERCQVFFRPGFGPSHRKTSSPQFGDIDFILLSQTTIYLGASQWHRAEPALENGLLTLPDEQLVHHEVFRCYLKAMKFGIPFDWQALSQRAAPMLQMLSLQRAMPPAGSLLDEKLQTVLQTIHNYYTLKPQVKDLMLYYHNGSQGNSMPKGANHKFEYVPLNYGGFLHNTLLKMEL